MQPNPTERELEILKIIWDRGEATVREVYEESDAYPIYEGRIGASPREMRGILLDAAQSTVYRCLSPLAVLDEIEHLCQRKAEFEWLQQDTQAGGYHDVKLFRETLFSRLLTAWEQELYASSGLVEDQQYDDLFERYVRFHQTQNSIGREEFLRTVVLVHLERQNAAEIRDLAP